MTADKLLPISVFPKRGSEGRGIKKGKEGGGRKERRGKEVFLPGHKLYCISQGIYMNK